MEWFENENFWRELYPYMFPPERFEAGAREVECVQQLARLSQGAVLDLCCGPGRHSVEFAKRGFRVTGVDASLYLLEQARQRASECKADIEWVKEDMRRFRRPSAFDLACSLFTSFGYFEAADEDLQVLRNAYDSLKPGGAFVMDVVGKEKVARNWQNSLTTEFPDGTLLVQIPKVARNWTRISNKWLLVRNGQAQTFAFEHTIYSGGELRDLLLRAGFGSIELYGNLQGAPYGLEAERLIAVARKSG